MAIPVPLDCVARCVYLIYYIKFLLGFYNPGFLQEYTDFCHGCNFESEAGALAASSEVWGYFFIALIFTAIAQSSDPKSQRHAILYSTILPVAKIVVLLSYGRPILGTGSEKLYISIGENVLILVGQLMTCFVWYDHIGQPKARGDTPMSWGSFDTACRVQYCEQFFWWAYATYHISNGDHEKMIPSEGGLLSAALYGATSIGVACILMGIATIDRDSQEKVVQYYLLKKIVEFFYLAPLALPFVSQPSAGGLYNAYLSNLWVALNTTHLLYCCYGGSLQRAVFWFASLVSFFIGFVCMTTPGSGTEAATAFLRVVELAGVPENVFRLVGLGAMLGGASFAAFSQSHTMAGFEVLFVWFYGIMWVFNWYHNVYMGLFSDLWNLFFVWCIWLNYAHDLLGALRPSMPEFLFKSAKQVADVTSPKSSKPAMKRGRSKTPGKKA